MSSEHLEPLSPVDSTESYKSNTNDNARRESSGADADESSSVETIKLISGAVYGMHTSHSNLSMLGGINSQVTLGSHTTDTTSQTAMVSHEGRPRSQSVPRNPRSRSINRPKSYTALKIKSETNHIDEYTTRHRQYKPVYEQPFNSVSVESFKFSGYLKNSTSMNRSNKVLPKRLRYVQQYRRRTSPIEQVFVCSLPKNACSSKSENSRLWTNLRIRNSGAVSLVYEEKRCNNSSQTSRIELQQNPTNSLNSPSTQKILSAPKNYIRQNIALVSEENKRSNSHPTSRVELQQSSSMSWISPSSHKMPSPTGFKNYIRENIARVSSRPLGLLNALRMPSSERPPLSGTNGLLRNNITSPNQTVTKGSKGIPPLPQQMKVHKLLLTRPSNVGVLSPTAPIPDLRPGSAKPKATPAAVETPKAKKTKTGGKKKVPFQGVITEKSSQAGIPKVEAKKPSEPVKKLQNKVAPKPRLGSAASLASSPYITADVPEGLTKASIKNARVSLTSVKSLKRSKIGGSIRAINKKIDEDSVGEVSLVPTSSKTKKLPVLKKKPLIESVDPYYVEATPSDKVMIDELVKADLDKILERDAIGGDPSVTDGLQDDQEPVPKAAAEGKRAIEKLTSPHAIKSAPLPRRVKAAGQVRAKRPGTAASGTNSREEEQREEIVLKGLKKPMKKSKPGLIKPL